MVSGSYPMAHILKTNVASKFPQGTYNMPDDLKKSHNQDSLLNQQHSNHHPWVRINSTSHCQQSFVHLTLLILKSPQQVEISTTQSKVHAYLKAPELPHKRSRPQISLPNAR
ncbi:hypothetical protein Droror1_Dr00015008 [Drosera rotundifolia]